MERSTLFTLLAKMDDPGADDAVIRLGKITRESAQLRDLRFSQFLG